MPTNQKEYMKEYMTQYYEKKKATIKCETCGSEIKEYQKYKHNKTKKHLNALFVPIVKESKNDKEEFTNDEIKLIRQFINKKEASDKYDSDQNGFTEDV
jgi:hypothetical protein